MSVLIGIYRSPTGAMVEQDDEARRTLAETLREGGQLLGSFGNGAGDEDLGRLFAAIVERLGKREKGNEREPQQ